MDAIFIDRNGEKKNFLYQYDKGQCIKVINFPYSTAPKVHFSIKSIPFSLPVQSTLSGSTLYVFIPNDLLAIGEDITAHIYIENDPEGYVIDSIFVSVCPRKRPSDYTDSGDMPEIPSAPDDEDTPIVSTSDAVYYGTYITEDESKIPYIRDMTADTLTNNSITFVVNAYRKNEYMYFFAPDYLGDFRLQTGTLPGGWKLIGKTTVMIDGLSMSYKVYKTDWDMLGKATWTATVI